MHGVDQLRLLCKEWSCNLSTIFCGRETDSIRQALLYNCEAGIPDGSPRLLKKITSLVLICQSMFMPGTPESLPMTIDRV